eukprot:TRINITY_DN75522_c0_g1_i1.p1 TRINITY_DN75522_c0_g1~~TRINITY_DN75522_c0_g1_i1.p1  ORF type:complete len:307 (+),score=36.89 TRINITY_DN75522_c0_g1_i1:31-951(+)
MLPTALHIFPGFALSASCQHVRNSQGARPSEFRQWSASWGGQARQAAGVVITLTFFAVVRSSRQGRSATARRCGAGAGFTLLAGERAMADGCKTVHFVRHSEAMVNAAGRVFAKDDPRKKAVRLDAKHFDSPLSVQGLKEAGLLCAGQLKGRGVPPEVEIVAASPLTRALQTATVVFGCAAAGGPRLYALDALREFCSTNYQPCDSRRAPEELAEEFPYVDFRNVSPGADTLLGPGKVESPDSADQRIRRLFSWLRDQPCSSIACVAHMQILTRIFTKHLQPAGLDCAHYGAYGNHEVRSVSIASK